MLPKVLLILPCMNWNKYKQEYTKSRFWAATLSAISRWNNQLDIVAIDCIVLRSTGKMLGLWSPFVEKQALEEIVELGLDSYPSWSKYSHKPSLMRELYNAVDSRLSELSGKYDRIVAFINVKAYYQTLRELSSKYSIRLLPNRVAWKAARAVPYRNIAELRDYFRTIFEPSADPYWRVAVE